MKLYEFIAGVACSIGVLLTGCSEDVIDTAISLPDGTPSELTLNCVNTVQSVPVQANGEWTAKVVYDDSSVSDDAGKWIGLLNHRGEGNGSLDFVVDANNSEAFRNATIVLTSGNSSLEYKVGQHPVGYGEDNENIDMSMFGRRVPLGFGIRMNKPKAGTNVSNILLGQVIKVNALSDDNARAKELVAKFGLTPKTYVDVDSSVNKKSTLISKESVEASSREILANLKVNVAYGMFKLNLNGNFKMFGGSSDSVYNFSAIAAPKKGTFYLQSNVINSDISKLAEKSTDDKATADEKKEALNLIFSNDFLELRDEIEEYVAKGMKYSADTKNDLYFSMKALDNKFGPAYITSAEVGGTAELNYLVAMKNAKDTLDIHGDLTFGLNALLSLDASVSADYNDRMNSYIKEWSFDSRIKGGSLEAATNFGLDLAKLMDSKSNIDLATVQQKLEQWALTVNFGNSTCVSYSPEPIWDLFSRKAAKELMHYFWDTYPNNKDKCPYTYDVRGIIEEINGGF